MMFERFVSILHHPFIGTLVLLSVPMLVAFFVLSVVTQGKNTFLRRYSDSNLHNALAWFGLVLLPLGLIVLAAAFYELLALIYTAPSLEASEKNASHVRWHSTNMLGMLAAIGAMFTLGFAFIRVFTTERQTRTAEEQALHNGRVLFNQKIEAAANGLHSQRQVSVKLSKGETDAYENIWEDDIVRRNSSIDQLEELVEQEPHEAPRVLRILAVYLSELSRQYEPAVVSDEDTLDWNIINALAPKRSDMEKSAKTIGTLRYIKGVKSEELRIRLRRANMQAMDLRDLNFAKSSLFDCNLQRANLIRADLTCSDIAFCKLEWCRVMGVKMLGVQFMNSKLDRALGFEGSDIRYSGFYRVDLSRLEVTQDQLNGVFCDMSVDLPEGFIRPDHWPVEHMDWTTFLKAWRAWQTSIGFDPNDPKTWAEKTTPDENITKSTP